MRDARTYVIHLVTAMTAGVLVVACSHTALAQSVQVAPFLGYRFGGDLFEEITATPLDIDGALSYGVVVDAFIDRDTSVTILYSHEEALIDVPQLDRPPHRTRLSIDQWHAGGTQELQGGPVRPFLLGTLGLTRYYGGGDSEIRFSLGAGGGVKLMPSEHLGARFDGRVYATFVDGGATTGICTPGACVIGLDVSVVWQAEFTAGLIVSF
jgi:hypothetical protein